MISVSDIMIGDYLQNTNGNIGRVVGIHNYAGTDPTLQGAYEVVMQYHENSLCYSDPKMLQPIPITPEILEKNGFVESGCPFTFDTGDDDVIIELYDPDPRARLSDKNRYDKEVGVRLFRRPPYSWGMDECMIIRANYVHELQHALRLCGINLEIKL